MSDDGQTNTPLPADSGQPAKPAKRGAVTSILLGGATGLVVALGVLAGTFASTRMLTGTPASRAAEETKAPEEEPAPAPSAVSAVSDRRLDELIEEGRFAPALEIGRASAGPTEPLPPGITYRLALSLEGLGRDAEAMAAYRDCISRSTSEHLRAAAQLGLARLALRRGQRDEGRELLCGLLTRSAQPAIRSRPYMTEALVLLALTLADEFLPGDAPSATRPTALARALPGTAVDRYVGWDTPPRGPTPLPALAWAPTGALTVHKADNGLRAEASLPAGSVVEQLERLARAAGRETLWGPGARDALLGREGELACPPIPLEDLLIWLTMPFGLSVQMDTNAVKIRVLAKLPAEERQRLRGALTMDSLRAALSVAGSHPNAGHLYLALGNLEATLGKSAEARGWYDRLLRDRPRSPALVPGMYNLGLLWLAEGDLVRARQAFYQAIDRAPGHEMTALCYWWIARTHLDEADTTRSRQALHRCAQAGSSTKVLPRGTDTSAAAGLGLACAALYDGEPRLAWESLKAVRMAVQEPPFLEPAAMLDGLARYQLAGDDTKRREAVLTELLGILLTPREATWLGPMLPYLRGKGLRELGLAQEMVGLYDRQAKSVRGPLTERMLVEVAETLFAAGQDAEARKRFDQLRVGALKGGNAELLTKVILRLAALDLRANQPDACLGRCRELLKDQAGDRGAILALMSRAYTSKKDHSRAAACLAGEVPAP